MDLGGVCHLHASSVGLTRGRGKHSYLWDQDPPSFVLHTETERDIITIDFLLL